MPPPFVSELAAQKAAASAAAQTSVKKTYPWAAFRRRMRARNSYPLSFLANHKHAQK